MMTAFVAVVALMVLAAIALLVYPLVGPAPAAAKGEPVAPKAAPLAFALAVALGLGAVGAVRAGQQLSLGQPDDGRASAARGTARWARARFDGRGRGLARGTPAEGARTTSKAGACSAAPTWCRGDAAKAAAAYEKANSIAPQKDIGLLLDLAEALVLTDDPAVQPRARAILDEALAADAQQPEGALVPGRHGRARGRQRDRQAQLDASCSTAIRRRRSAK